MMKWIELSIHSTNEAVEPIANILHEHGAQGVVIEDPAELVKERDNIFGEIYQLNPADFPADGVILKAYFAMDDFSDELYAEIISVINKLTNFSIDLGRNSSMLNEVDDEDWATAWKKYYHPVKISEQITIVPTWEEYTPKPNEKIILLDPGMAFGTGTHPTTVLCIRALEKWVKHGATVLDVGTGSGVLSISAALLGATTVLAMDLDSVAVKVAEENCQVNKVSETITVFQNDLLENVNTTSDVIVANILADIIIRITDDVFRLLQKDGVFIASGIIKEKQDFVIAAMEASGLDIVEIAEQDDWVAITAEKNGGKKS